MKNTEKINELRLQIEKSEKYISGKRADYENAISQHQPKVDSALMEISSLLNTQDVVTFSNQSKIDFINSTLFDVTRQMSKELDDYDFKEGDNIITLDKVEYLAVVEYGTLKRFLPIDS